MAASTLAGVTAQGFSGVGAPATVAAAEGKGLFIAGD
jgi:hypothetical protein